MAQTASETHEIWNNACWSYAFDYTHLASAHIYQTAVGNIYLASELPLTLRTITCIGGRQQRRNRQVR